MANYFAHFCYFFVLKFVLNKLSFNFVSNKGW